MASATALLILLGLIFLQNTFGQLHFLFFSLCQPPHQLEQQGHTDIQYVFFFPCLVCHSLKIKHSLRTLLQACSSQLKKISLTHENKTNKQSFPVNIQHSSTNNTLIIREASQKATEYVPELLNKIKPWLFSSTAEFSSLLPNREKLGGKARKKIPQHLICSTLILRSLKFGGKMAICSYPILISFPQMRKEVKTGGLWEASEPLVFPPST